MAADVAGNTLPAGDGTSQRGIATAAQRELLAGADEQQVYAAIYATLLLVHSTCAPAQSNTTYISLVRESPIVFVHRWGKFLQRILPQAL